jgi:hypothetical protein
LVDDPATGELQLVLRRRRQLYYGAADGGADLLADSDDPRSLVQGEGITTFGVKEVARAGAGNPRKENNREWKEPSMTMAAQEPVGSGQWYTVTDSEWHDGGC